MGGWAKRMEKEGKDTNEIKKLQGRFFPPGCNFVYTVDEKFVQNSPAHLLVLMGMDEAHPVAISKQIALLSPNAELVEDWKRSEVVTQTCKKVTDFMTKHAASCTPAKL